MVHDASGLAPADQRFRQRGCVLSSRLTFHSPITPGSARPTILSGVFTSPYPIASSTARAIIVCPAQFGCRSSGASCECPSARSLLPPIHLGNAQAIILRDLPEDYFIRVKILLPLGLLLWPKDIGRKQNQRDMFRFEPLGDRPHVLFVRLGHNIRSQSLAPAK